MNISIGENSRNKKNPFECIVPPPYDGVGTIKLMIQSHRLGDIFHDGDTEYFEIDNGLGELK